MKICPECQEEFEDDMNFCLFDGASLRPPGAGGGSSHFSLAGGPAFGVTENRYRPSNRFKTAFFILFAITIICAGAWAAYSRFKRPPSAPAQQEPSKPPGSPRIEAASPQAQDYAAPTAAESLSITDLSHDELLKILPKNLMHRFHEGEREQGKPDDFRVLRNESDQYVALIGGGRSAEAPKSISARLLILKVDGQQFRDVTRQSAPGRLAAGLITGARSRIQFDEGTNLVARVPVLSSAIIDECATCEHAYQLVTMTWKGGAYVESAREWDNDRYSAFYAAADALDKRNVDSKARAIIERTVDPYIAQGFSRREKKGWSVGSLTEDNTAATADYELSNGSGHIVIRVSKINGEWRAVKMR